MKANEAPEKLYLISDEDGVALSYDPSTKLQYGNRYDFVDKEIFPIEEGCDIEYTRTDTFIKKAREFLSKESNIPLWEGYNYDFGCDTRKLVENFINYMKGE